MAQAFDVEDMPMIEAAYQAGPSRKQRVAAPSSAVPAVF